MGWDIGCYVFGAISIIGPILLVFWYIKGAKAQIERLNQGK
jgi:hypothetical protein